MVEVIDKETNQKLMMMIICGISYLDNNYLIYSIRRDDENVNVFVSKLIKGSLGYVISNDFSNGEKEVLDGVAQRIINRESEEQLEGSGFSIIRNVEMDTNLFFEIDKCYVCTILRSSIKNCLIHYGLVNKSMFSSPVVEVIDDEKKFNEGFISSIALIVICISITVFAFIVIYGILKG